MFFQLKRTCIKFNKGNTKRGVSPLLKIWPGDLDLWPWKSIASRFSCTKLGQNPLKDIDSRVFTGCYAVKNLTQWPWPLILWPWKSIGFQTLLRTKYVSSLVKIHWRLLILECSQGCYGRTDGRTDGSITISLRNFVGEGIILLTKDRWLFIWTNVVESLVKQRG